MASAWSQLDQLLTCAICLDRYRNPKLLPCQHTFCMEPCLDGLIDYARRQIKCPECRAEHRIPYKGIQEFPTNVTLMRFLELHRDITGEEPEPPPSMMERCSVCSEKASLEKCAHCEKKICPDCKEAHIDILRREINRINNQVRRGLHRLSEALAQTKKNADKLQQNCTQVKDEIEDIVRRYSKDLKHTEEKLKHDLEIYTDTELKSINKLKDDLEAEVSNMSSNCDLVDLHIKDDAEWTDIELLEYKEIFLKTLDFLRSFDSDSSDFSRRIKFLPRADPDVLHRNIADFGELKINSPLTGSMSLQQSQQTLAPPPSNGLMRSQSDHRLAAQFARRSEGRSSFVDRYGGSDNERDGRPTSPLYGRGKREPEVSGYRRYSERNKDYEQDRPSNRYGRDDVGSLGSSRWRENDDYGQRSRYNRDYEDYDSEPQHTSSSRTVRFADESTQRERMFDVDTATKGPLSGVIRLLDSPKIMERLHQNEVRQKQQQQGEKESQPDVILPIINRTEETRPPTQPTPVVPQRKTTSRQLSEDDIDKQKKANQQQEAKAALAAPSPSSTTTTTATSTTTTSTPIESTSIAPREDIKPEPPKGLVKGRLERQDTVEVDSTSSRKETVESKDSSPRSYRSFIADKVENPPASSTSSAYPRFPWQTLGKTVSSSSSEPTHKSTPVGKPASTQLTAANKLTAPQPTPAKDDHSESSSSSDDDDDDNEDEAEGAAEPPTVQSSFFTRPRRLPDPEPRLLQTNQDSDGDSEDDEDDEEDEEDEDEEDNEDEKAGVAPKVESQPNRTAEADEASDDSEDSTSSSSESEASSESDGESSDANHDSRRNDIPDISSSRSQDQRSSDIDDNVSSDELLNSSYKKNQGILDEDQPQSDMSQGSEANCSLGVLTVRRSSDPPEVNFCEPSQLPNFRRRSDEVDSSSGSSSSSNYQSFSNTTTTGLSNGTTVDENNDAESKKEPSRFSRRRHPILSRSKSSHELGHQENAEVQDDETEEEPAPTYRSRAQRMSEDILYRPSPRSKYHSSSPSATNRTTSQDSSWANYLKNKYGSNATGRVVPRSRSSHSLYQMSDSDDSEEEAVSGRDSNLSGSIAFNSPRSTYLQKRRMLFKIGSRGTESGNFTWPRGIAVSPDDSIVVADSNNHRVQVFAAQGKFLFEFGSYGSCEGQFDCLSGVSVNRIGQFIVSDRYNHRVQLFDPSGRFLRAFGSEGHTDGRFSYPWGITTDSLGFIYVCDKENHRIQVFQSDGTFVGKFGGLGSRPGQLEHPHYIAVSNTNRVVVSDSNNHRIQIFDVNGRMLSTFGSEGSVDGQFKFPRGVAVDDQGFILVGDSGNNRIQIFHPDGNFLRSFGTWGSGDGEFKGLEGIAVTSAGNILVCDRENHRVQVF